ncbi:MAG: hypothetical protein F6K14_10525 [Symploca sp. SIO2C1]|nr:hypothetical protein [Symploca sp. SIO2C1]
MTQLQSYTSRRRGRLFPDYIIPPEELAKRKSEREARGKRCRAVLERVRPHLIETHYNWFIIIEPNSGDYFLDPDEQVAMQKARQKYPKGWMVIFRLNKTGTCGKI